MNREQIELLIDLANSDPAAALGPAEDAAASADGEDRAAALLAVGLAHRNLGDAIASVDHLTVAAKATVPGSELRARIELSLAGSLGFVGRFDDALALLDRLVQQEDELEAAKAEHQRATLMQRAGETERAVDGYERAITIFKKHQRFTAQGHLHTNLGILYTYEGQIDAALTELDLAMSCYEQSGELKWQAMTVHNRGWTVSCTGDLPAALTLLDEAEDRFAALQIPEGSRLAVRAEALLRAGLYERAYDALVAAGQELERLGLATDRAEVLVQASQAATMAGQPVEGLDLAKEALSLLEDQGRTGWKALAVAAHLEAGGDVSDAATLRPITDELVAAGHSAVAFRIQTAAAEAVAEEGRFAEAERFLAGLPVISQTPSEQVRLAATRTRLLVAAGDPEGAIDVAEEAYRRIDRFIGGVGSLDLIAGAAYELDRLVQAAKSAMSPNEVEGHLTWAERRRAVGARRWPRNTAPEVRALLNRYRATDGQLQETPDDPKLREELTGLQLEIEATGWSTGQSRSVVPPVASLEVSTTQIDLSVLDDEIYVTIIRPGHDAFTDRRPLDRELIAATDRLHRLWMGAVGGQEPALAKRCLDLGAELEASLFGSVDVTDEPLTIAVDPELRSVPFGCLPCSHRAPLAISPWRRASAVEVASEGRLLIPDPDLSVADRERSSITADGDWHVLDVSDRVDEAVDRLSRSRVVHISTHGGSEAGNPMFSWLGLPSGRLYLQDLVRLPSAPEVVVIAACLASRAESFGAAGALSFAEGFLGAGCRAVIASPSVLPDDDQVARLVGELHRYLADGDQPVDALLRAKQAAVERNDHRAASAFVCYSS